MNSLRKSLTRWAGVAIALTGAVGGAAMAASPSVAHADPGFVTAKVGVGSDTIQDLFNGYQGAEPYPGSGVAVKGYTALYSTAPGGSTIASFDALPFGGSPAAPGCITSKLNGPSFDRPNGSTAGIAALNKSFGQPISTTDVSPNNNWDALQVPSSPPALSVSCTKAVVNIAGEADFARSSAGVTETGNKQNTWIPFARDAVAVAFIKHGTAAIATIDVTSLKNLYLGSTTTFGADTVIPCLPQSTSGTRKFFLKTVLGLTSAQQTTADTTATNAGCNSIEENNANTFFTKANALLGGTKDAVIPFSVGSFSAQVDGVAIDNSSTGVASGVDLANIGGISVAPDSTTHPYNGTIASKNLTPSHTYYASTTVGRYVYVVVPTASLDPVLGDADIISLFANTATLPANNAQICQTAATNLSTSFGFDQQFLAGDSCGMTTIQGED